MKIAKTKNGSLKAYFFIPWGPTEMNNSISCLPGNRKWNYFCQSLKENSQDMKIVVDKHIYVVPGDMLT